MKTIFLFIAMLAAISTCHVVDKDKKVLNILQDKATKIYDIIIEEPNE